VTRALEAAGADVVVTERPGDLNAAHGVVLPGDGAAASAMRGLAERDLIAPLRDVVASGRPFLGVCLGLQVLMSWSEENDGVECLGVIPGRVVRLPEGLKVPHIGWNQVDQRQPHRVFDGIPDGANFYFLHSYVVRPDDPAMVLGTTAYEIEFVSVVARGNVVATQFHPEKSASAGLRLYRNFAGWVAESHLPIGSSIRGHS
jgi:glutamine amidotransferase